MSQNKKDAFGYGLLIVLIGVFGWYAFGGKRILTDPNAPIPTGWNPSQPLNVKDSLTPLTMWKLKLAIESRSTCEASLKTASIFDPLEDKLVSETCHVKDRVVFHQASDAAFRSFETRCDMALLTSMWMEHGVQPAAQKHFGQKVKSVRTQGSYNCRKIFGTNRMSKHAEAKAIDVAGFILDNGEKIELIDHWGDGSSKASFLKDVRDSACKWFETTLGPEYNRAHADHFHLQSEGWGTCR